ncbi:hypothetical protein Cgig2_006393 [Carnegiea gigantea]|uniref:Uncharacterized protein n=1 Tax=Carnegiea gigantea TaxID=171969 RepID=A0A9Q1K6C2_9CARY|nr:hypothetical protein Cgig2_006393 [Carnegiea gigantea]
MVVNNTVRLFVMSRDIAGALKSVLKGLRWIIFESWQRINKHALLGAQLPGQANPGVELGPANDQEESSVLSHTMVFPDFHSTKQAAGYIKRTFRWHWRGALRHPRPLPDNYHYLCPHFDLDIAEESAREFCILEMTQAAFYVMEVNDALELGVMSRELVEHLKASLEGQSRSKARIGDWSRGEFGVE